MMKSKLPDLTQQPIKFVDATPDEEYPLRILQAYREDCNCKWSSDTENALIRMMNEMCDKRAEILDRAIEILERNK
uniref:Uncharacterized protein n=1 Tax=viral metagenome TaxID=1070528 RepID=A0A6M3L3B3_9ZZZZ